MIIYGGFHSHGGTPIAGWLIWENNILKWMMTGGTPILGNPHMGKYGDSGDVVGI